MWSFQPKGKFTVVFQGLWRSKIPHFLLWDLLWRLLNSFPKAYITVAWLLRQICILWWLSESETGENTNFYTCIGGGSPSLTRNELKSLFSKYKNNKWNKKTLFPSRNTNRTSYIAPSRINCNKKFLIK